MTYRISVLLMLALTLNACGSGSGDGDGESTVQPFTQPTIDETSGNTSGSDNDSDSVEQPIELGMGSSYVGAVGLNEFASFIVPADSQIVLRSNTGDSDLFVFNSADYSSDSLICRSVSSYKEDLCSTDASAGQYFVAVTGELDVNAYTLQVTNDCSTESINHWVYRSMKDYYLFADQVPDIDPSVYESTSELVRALRFSELENYSYIREASGQTALYEEGRTFGLGHHRWRRDDDGNLRVLDVSIDSPFGQAGVQRGDIFYSAGGILDDDLTNEQYYELVGPLNNPNDVEWAFIDAVTGDIYSFITKEREYTINTVSTFASYSVAGMLGEIGYIAFKRFLEPSINELNNVISQLSQRNVTELVLDLRYNGGGRVSVARRLAAQLAGNSLEGEVFGRVNYNDTYSFLNYTTTFPQATPALDLSRIVVLTSDDTASASELVINALRPYFEVVTLGTRTEGKPFRSSARTFCGMSLNAMHAQSANANGTNVFGGIEADCYAEDDMTRDYGFSAAGGEGMLVSAVNYLVSGTC